MKWTDASDDAYDKKHKIVEGSKKDLKLDAQRGVAETDTTHPFGHPKVKVQRDQMAGHAKALAMGTGKPAMTVASTMAKGTKLASKGKSFRP